MTPLLIGPFHTKAESPKKPEQEDDENVQRAEDAPLDAFVQSSSIPVKAEAAAQDREV